MINFELRNMPDFFFGRGMERKCGELIREFGGSRVLLHHSGEAFVLPLIESLKGYIEEAGLSWVELGGVVPNPRLSKIYEGIKLGKKEKIDCVLAVGGGSVIDSAKGIAMGCAYDGDVWDFYSQKAVPQKMLVLGVISTFAGTGSESSRASVVTNDETQLKRSADDFDLMRPDFAILNPELTQSIPPFQTASGAADIFSHLCENYFSSTDEIYLSRQLLTAGMKTVLKNAPLAVSEPENYAARSALMMTAPLAVNGIMRLVNFYISAVDEYVKAPEDKPTIGLLLCRSKSDTKARFALRGITQPLGIAQYETEKLFEDVASALPQIEDIENQLEDKE